MFETPTPSLYTASLAADLADVRAAQRLRYKVFVEELGASGPLVDHESRLEVDSFDDFAEHLLVRRQDTQEVVAVYRLMQRKHAEAAGQFYTASEFDLEPVLSSSRSVLELGRSCVHPAHRGGQALFHMWAALADYVSAHKIEVLFGVASLPGTDIEQHAPVLSLLAQHHLAPPSLRVRSTKYQPMNLIEPGQYDKRAATIALPPLIKAYLRLGGLVGDGAFVDNAFKCTDVCLIMDTEQLNTRHARHYLSAQPS